jgi:hypothetical protein
MTKVKFLKQVSNRLRKIEFWESEVKSKIKLKQVLNRLRRINETHNSIKRWKTARARFEGLVQLI